MAIKFLYANGDSYVHGQGLDDSVHLYDFNETKKQNCWTGIIAKQLGLNIDIQYKNNSLPGASNDRIFRTTINDVSSLIKQYLPSEIFVIIGLSEASRTEIYSTGEQDYSPFLFHCPPGKDSPQHIKRWHDLHSAFFVNNRDNEDRFFSKFIALQSFLKMIGVNYIFTKSIAIFPDTYQKEECRFKNADSWCDTISLIDFKKFYEQMHFAHFVNINNLSLTPCRHTGPDGHRAWAEHILNFIEENYDAIIK